MSLDPLGEEWDPDLNSFRARNGAFDMLRVVLCLLLSAGLAVRAATAAPTPAQRCTAAKLKAVGKKYLGKLTCASKAALKGLPIDAACLAKVETKFLAAFTSAEARGGCLTTGDAAAIEAVVDACVADAVAALGPTTTTTSSTTTTTTPVCTVDGAPCALCAGGVCRTRVAVGPLVCVHGPSCSTPFPLGCADDTACGPTELCVEGSLSGQCCDVCE